MDAASFSERKVSVEGFDSENVKEEVIANTVDDCEELVAVVGGWPCVAGVPGGAGVEQGLYGVVTRYEVVLLAGHSSCDHSHCGVLQSLSLSLCHAKWFSSVLLPPKRR